MERVTDPDEFMPIKCVQFDEEVVGAGWALFHMNFWIGDGPDQYAEASSHGWAGIGSAELVDGPDGAMCLAIEYSSSLSWFGSRQAFIETVEAGKPSSYELPQEPGCATLRTSAPDENGFVILEAWASYPGEEPFCDFRVRVLADELTRAFRDGLMKDSDPRIDDVGTRFDEPKTTRGLRQRSGWFRRIGALLFPALFGVFIWYLQR